jgi:hypothetical protein
MEEDKTTSLTITEEFKPEEKQFAEQLYNSAGLNSVVDDGLHDYDKHIQSENKLINKVFGARDTDIRGYGEAVAKRVAVAVYTQLSRQYGGKVGDLRSYIMALEEERDQAKEQRDQANLMYDQLMGRAIGILGEEYKELRTDSKEFMEKLTNVMGEDLKVSRINSEAITEKLADIDGLRSQIRTLTKEKELLADTSTKEKELLAGTSAKEKEQLKERYEQKITTINDEHRVEIRNLNDKHESQIAETHNEYKAEIRRLNSRVEILTKEKDLQKEQYESQIADLDSTVRGFESKKSDSKNDLEQSSNQVDTQKDS